MPRRAWPLAVVIAVPIAQLAAAAEPEEAIRLEYRASRTCPNAGQFEARVRALTARARFVVDSPKRTFRVELDAGAPSTGRLTIRRGNAVEGERQIHADTCSDVADAIALAAALAVDPEMLAPAPPSASAPPSVIAPIVAPPASSVAPPAPPPLPPPTPAPSSPQPVPTPLPRFTIGSELDVSTGVSTRPLVGATPSIGWESPSTLHPSLRLSFVRASSRSFEVTAGSAASFTWTVGRLDGCLGPWTGARLRVVGCARIEIGALEGEGGNILDAQRRTTAWVAAGPVVRVEWIVYRPLFVGLSVGGSLHLTADRFYFAPDLTVYDVARFGLDASAGVGVHFL